MGNSIEENRIINYKSICNTLTVTIYDNKEHLRKRGGHV